MPIHVRNETELARLGIRVDLGDTTQAVPIRPARAGQPGPVEPTTAGGAAPETRPGAAGSAGARSAGRQPRAEGDVMEKILRDLFPPLERHQAEALRRMIESGELAPRVVVWKGTGVVVDGRETRRICEELGRVYQTEEREFEDLDAVVCWRITKQLLHRNLTRTATYYYRGKHYNTLKRQGRRPDDIYRQTGEISTAKLLGRLYRVGKRTIERDGELCEALDSVAEKSAEELLDTLFPDGFVLGAEYRGGVLSGRIRPNRDEVIELSRMRLDEMARAIKDKLDAEKKPRRKVGPPMPGPAPPKAALPGPVPAEPLEPSVPVEATPALPPGPRDDPEAIDEAGLEKANEAFGRLNPATQKAFLKQDHVSRRACEAGFVRTERPGAGGGAA